jgi:hypothetical protein
MMAPTEKFYAATHHHEYNDEKRNNIFVCRLRLLEGTISTERDFGFFMNTLGRYRWVHIATGTQSLFTYKTLGGCRRAVSVTKKKILGSIYYSEFKKANNRRFRDCVTEADAEYFERIGIRDQNLSAPAPAGPAREVRYWYQDM